MINKVIFEGYIAKDIELRKTQNDKSVINFSLGVPRLKQKGKEAQSDFFNCVVWGATADVLARYFRKGSAISIEGRLESSSYQKDGRTVYKVDVQVEKLHFPPSSKKSIENQSIETDLKGSNEFDDFDAGPTLDISSDDLPF